MHQSKQRGGIGLTLADAVTGVTKGVTKVATGATVAVTGVTKVATVAVTGVTEGATVVGKGVKGGVSGVRQGYKGVKHGVKGVKHALVGKKPLVRQNSRQAWSSRVTAPEAMIQLSFQCQNLPKKNTFSESDAFCVIWEAPADYRSMSSMSSAQTIGPSKLPTGKENKIGETEIVNDCDPIFSKTFRRDFSFEMEQLYVVRVYDRDLNLQYTDDLQEHDYLGGAIFSLGELMGSPGTTLTRPLRANRRMKNSALIIKGKEIEDTLGYFDFRFSAEKLQTDDVIDKVNPYFKVETLGYDRYAWEVKWKSEVVKNSINPTWNEAKLPLQMLISDNKHSFDGYRNRQQTEEDGLFKVTIWDYQKGGGDNHEPLGFVEANIDEMLMGSKRGIPVFDVVKEKKKMFGGNKLTKNGELKVLKARIAHAPSMIAYISGGCEIDMAIAVDFTTNNGPFIDDDATGHGSVYDLHQRQQHFLNDYQATIKKLGTITEAYNKTKQFAMVGYGATVSRPPPKSNDNKSVSPPRSRIDDELQMSKTFFPMANRVSGAAGLLKAYEKTLESPFLEMREKAYLKPVIEAAVYRSIKLSQKKQKYSIFCILTSGEISDLSDAFEAIKMASEDAPISIVFIGIGKGNFTEIEKLCDESYNKRLCHSNGVPISRNIVSFAKFAEYPSTMKEITKEVVADSLCDIPEQMCTYFVNNGIKPHPPLPVPKVNHHDELLDSTSTKYRQHRDHQSLSPQSNRSGKKGIRSRQRQHQSLSPKPMRNRNLNAAVATAAASVASSAGSSRGSSGSTRRQVKR